jgi:hypothetical protein
VQQEYPRIRRDAWQNIVCIVAIAVSAIAAHWLTTIRCIHRGVGALAATGWKQSAS